jgi:hypothetical protein
LETAFEEVAVDFGEHNGVFPGGRQEPSNDAFRPKGTTIDPSERANPT